DGSASVTLDANDAEVLEMMKERTMSDPTSSPITGADLGSGFVQGKDL
ncbi:manganese catalase family protein, partial [Pseudomonas syringae]|nr:manganese catalase family protein [Pseudomonas syringae]